MVEEDVERLVVDTARQFGWARYHPRWSMGSSAGWPDETLVRGTRMVVAELKGTAGRVSKPQQDWLDRLRQVETVEVHLWTPDDLDDILKILR